MPLRPRCEVVRFRTWADPWRGAILAVSTPEGDSTVLRSRRLIPLALAAATATLLGGSLLGPPATGAAAPALVLNYTFDAETGTVVKDRSTYANNGQLVNTSAPGAYVTGLTGHKKALKLVGAQHQFVNVPDASASSLDVNKYSLAAWVRYTGVQNDQTLGRWEILEKDGAYWMNIRTNGLLRVGGFYGGCANAYWKYFDSPNPIPVNTWTHVASTYNGAQLTIWINGVRVGTRAITGTTCTNNEPLAVGAKNAVSKGLLEAFFDGNLDDVRVYSRVLTSTEIGNLAAR